MNRVVSTLLLLALASACQTTTGTPEPAPDAAGVEPRDAGETAPDAAVTPDAANTGVDAAVSMDAAQRPDAAVDGMDAGTIPDAAQPVDAGNTNTVDAGGGIGPRCFADIWDPATAGPNYDQFNPVVGNHCQGTNHQQITGIERVVFVGDSVTVGTPPTASGDFYRSRLANLLATEFNLEPPGYLWRTANALNGVAGEMFSGDFASCAKWGARTDDLAQDNSQLETCMPLAERNKKTLVVLTIGGNDIAALQKDGRERTYEQNFQEVAQFVDLLRQAIHWVKMPGRFPGGVSVVFGNMYEFTDGTGDTASCGTASLGGFTPWENQEDLERLVVWANEQFMQIAVETQSDMIFMLENFCGHGYKNEDPTGRCYRGPNTERWFDLTCIHPNPRGHEVIADMMMQVVRE